MRTMKLMKPAGPDRLELGTADVSGRRRPKCRCACTPNSLNDHDSLVVAGVLPAPRRSHSDG